MSKFFIIATMTLSSAVSALCPFVYLGGGYSWSMNGDINAPGSFWDPAPQGYNADLGDTSVYTLGFGVHGPCGLSYSLDVNYRPQFKYERFQEGIDSGQPGPLGDKTRYFKLSNLAFMANAFVNKTGNLWNYGSTHPFFGVGIGVSQNRLYDLHSVLASQVQGLNEIASIMTENKELSFGAQVLLGISTSLSCRLSLDVGYRFFYGGHFQSNNYITDILGGLNNLDGFERPSAAPAWTGDLYANEIFLLLNISL